MTSTSDADANAGTFCPYVGLQPFDASHADYFFGRRSDSADIADHLLARSITVLYGTSGVGKSSVLNVGLPRALDELQVAQKPQIFRQWTPISRVMAWLSEITARPEPRVLLIFDQFEEFFLYREAQEIEQFSKELRRLLRDPDRDVHVLLALRDDALHRLDAMRAYLPQAYDTTLELRPLEKDGVREAVEGPLRVYNDRYRKVNPIRWDTDLADYLSDEANWDTSSAVDTLQPRGRVELPFLQLALIKLWDKEGGTEAVELRVETLRSALGGIAGIAATHVEDKLGVLTRGERRTASQILHYLVTPSGGKIAYTQRDLESYAGTRDITRLLEELTRERILRGVGARYELFHDKLAEPLLKWRAKYLDEGPFACLRNVFTGAEYELLGFGHLFGRLVTPDDNVPNEPMSRTAISRNHLVILLNFELLDLRSVNGTTVNAQPVALGEPRRLESGDIVVLANSVPFVFFSIEDEEIVEGMPAPEAREARAAVIDGSNRAVSYVTSAEVGLRFSRGTGIRVVAADEPGVFATLSIRREPFLVFKPPELRPEVKVVTFKDSYNFPALPIKGDFPPEIPDTDEFRDARPRLLFVIEYVLGDQHYDVPFEIVLQSG